MLIRVRQSKGHKDRYAPLSPIALANRLRSHNLALARKLIASKLRPREPRPGLQHLCPQCGTGLMSLIARVAPYVPRTWFGTS